MVAFGPELEFQVMLYFFGLVALNSPLLWKTTTCPTSTFPKISGISAGTLSYKYNYYPFLLPFSQNFLQNTAGSFNK
jgi:hypothetical protein